MSEQTRPAYRDLSQLRIEYQRHALSQGDVDPDPIRQFLAWLDEAINAQVQMPEAMALATADGDGLPSARMVLLKTVDERGFAFYTNYDSRKGKELAANPRAALLFFWPELERQVRIEGGVQRTSDEESDAYFISRPIEAQIGGASSPQSQVVPSRAFLEQKAKEVRDKYPDRPIPRPKHWGGYRVVPERLEFWQGRPGRLHDRVEYVREGTTWLRRRLAP